MNRGLNIEVYDFSDLFPEIYNRFFPLWKLIIYNHKKEKYFYTLVIFLATSLDIYVAILNDKQVGRQGFLSEWKDVECNFFFSEFTTKMHYI